MEEGIKAEEVSFGNISDYYHITMFRVGYLYFNAINIQDIFNLKLKEIPSTITTTPPKKFKKNKFLSHQYNISYLSENCEVISSDVDILKTLVSGKSNRDIEIFNLNEKYDSNFDLKGRLKNIVNINDNTFIELTGETEKLVKIKNFLIQQQKTKKSIDFLSSFSKELLSPETTKPIKITVDYNIYFKSHLFHSLNNNNNEKENWFFQHFLTFKNEIKQKQQQESYYESIIQLTNEELDDFYIETHVYFKTFQLGEDGMMFQRIYLHNHSIPESQSYSHYEKISYSPKPQQKQQEQGEYEEETSSPSLRSNKKIISDISESINGKIYLSSENESSFLLYPKQKIKAKIFNLITFDHYQYNDISNIDFKDIQFDNIIHPSIVLVFVNNYLTKNNEMKINTLPVIVPGKLKIYNNDNEILSISEKELKVDSSTESIILGQSKNISILSKLLKKETSINSIIKFFLLKITNNSLSKSIITIKFENIEQITIIFNQTKEEEKSLNDEDIIKNIKLIMEQQQPQENINKIDFIGNYENNFTIFLDFNLQEKSIDYILFYIKQKK